MDIIKADDPTLGPKDRATVLRNNKKIREATVKSLADSLQVLAALWAGAWKVGNGSKIDKAQLVEFEKAT